MRVYRLEEISLYTLKNPHVVRQSACRPDDFPEEGYGSSEEVLELHFVYFRP